MSVFFFGFFLKCIFFGGRGRSGQRTLLQFQQQSTFLPLLLLLLQQQPLEDGGGRSTAAAGLVTGVKNVREKNKMPRKETRWIRAGSPGVPTVRETFEGVSSSVRSNEALVAKCAA